MHITTSKHVFKEHIKRKPYLVKKTYLHLIVFYYKIVLNKKHQLISVPLLAVHLLPGEMFML